MATFLASMPPLAFALAVAASAQDDPHAACGGAGWVPREILERPVALRSGAGNAHELVTTSSADAQVFYDQGLNYLHGYVWIEAARSFRQALRLDPDLAMAWVGLSRVYSGLDDAARARAALLEAKRLAPKASAGERLRVALRAQQLDAMDDVWNPTKHHEYKQAIDAALAAHPKDAESWLVRGNAEEPTAAGRGQRGTAASVAFYERALELVPDHAAAHHYLVHTYETIGRIDEALAHGEAFARRAPSIPHAHHMWGHDLRRVGRIEEAIAAFQRTDELEKGYYLAEQVPAELDWHHVHNLDLLATSLQHQGLMLRAEATMREAAALVPPIDRVEFDQKMLPAFLLGRERADEALAAARKLAEGRWGATRAVAQALCGHAYLARGRLPEARAALQAAERELGGVPAAAVGIGVSRAQVQPWIDALRGELLLRDRAFPEAQRVLLGVAKALREAPGPDAWIQAMFRLEAIARAAREAEAWDLAELIARQMLEHDAAYGGSHLALALVAEQRNDVQAASRALAAAERCWSRADPDLPELALVRARKARIAADADRPPVGAPAR